MPPFGFGHHDESSARDAAHVSEDEAKFVMIPHEQQFRAPANLHPYTRPLTISDLDSVVALENAAFTDPQERATKEKMIYRLTKCGELCLGIFCTVLPDSRIKAETLATGRPVETARRNGAISVLLGHVISVKTTGLVATDDSMSVPPDWASEHPSPTNLGHQESGRTIVLHSVAVLPEYQGHGLGRILMMAYMQQMNGASIADRLALIAHDHKISWYEKLGFTNNGKSDSKFSGGGWYDMTFPLKSQDARTAYG